MTDPTTTDLLLLWGGIAGLAAACWYVAGRWRGAHEERIERIEAARGDAIRREPGER